MCTGNSCPDARRPHRLAGLWAAGLAAWLGAPPVPGQVAAPELQPDMPITIDAESSEFDYATSRLVFRGLRLDQGNLGIRADVAETAELDFEDGTWLFRGNVRVEADQTVLWCDRAELTFRAHRLAAAELSGSPARFEQPDPADESVTSGTANRIVYRLPEATLQLSGGARFSDGTNEISGDLITYDLAARRITAGSGESGPVKILIEPRAREADEDETAAGEPEQP